MALLPANPTWRGMVGVIPDGEIFIGQFNAILIAMITEFFDGCLNNRDPTIITNQAHGIAQVVHVTEAVGIRFLRLNNQFRRLV